MNEAEYAAWIDELVEQGVYDRTLGDDFVDQRRLFEQIYRGRIAEGRMRGAVGCVSGVPVEAENVPDLVRLADDGFHGRALYFEALPPMGLLR